MILHRANTDAADTRARPCHVVGTEFSGTVKKAEIRDRALHPYAPWLSRWAQKKGEHLVGNVRAIRSPCGAGITPARSEGNAMADDTLHLTYRELADRLGISPDAARMKAKRAVKVGRWAIIPGNHPSDPVRVQLPAADAGKPERVAGERAERSGGERTGRTQSRTDTDPLALALQSAQARIGELTDQLTAEKDRHRDTAVELATATTKVDFLEAELARLGAEADQLRDDLRTARRTWWQRMTRK